MLKQRKIALLFLLILVLLALPIKSRAQVPQVSNIVELGIISVLGRSFQQGAVVNFYTGSGGYIDSVHPFWVSNDHLIVLPPEGSFYLQVINPPFSDQSASSSFQIPESLRRAPATASTPLLLQNKISQGDIFLEVILMM